MTDRRRQLGAFAVLSLVLLRLAVGWHFYREGSSKFTFDPATRHFDVTFSSEGFLSQAKGPLAEKYREFVPGGHDWQKLLAVPRADAPLSEEKLAELADWTLQYEQRRGAALNKGEPEPAVEFPPMAPYYDWAQRISDDWRAKVDKLLATPGLSDEQKEKANRALAESQRQLSTYFVSQLEAIVDYQYELFRTKEQAATPEADGVPFVERRLAGERAKNSRTPLVWVNQVKQFDAQLTDDLRSIVTLEQQADAAAAKAIDESLTTKTERRLQLTNLVVAVLTVSVGICLLVGFFTRLASLAGALFLATVIATQPPWVPGAAETYYQTVELAGLLVLAGTGAGRWAGLDYFGYALWSRIRGIS